MKRWNVIKMPKCRKCGVELTEENWYPSSEKAGHYICIDCERKRHKQWREANPDKVKASHVKANRKQGIQSFKENKECTMFLGVHIAERILSHVFKDVERMPIRNPGFDFVCSHDKLIDIKCSCLETETKRRGWSFNIKQNRIADFFLCLAFDNREDLNPLHIWLLPGSKFNHLMNAVINPNTVDRWKEYELDISKISDCCNAIR